MHQSKETNWRFSGGKDRRRSRFVKDDWGVLEDIFNQRHQKIRKRARRHLSTGSERESE